MMRADRSLRQRDLPGATKCVVVRDGAVSFLGPLGTFSESVVLKLRHESAGDVFPCETIADCLLAVDEGRARYALVPVENSTGGIVPDLWSVLSAKTYNHRFSILADVTIDVEQNLYVSKSTARAGVAPQRVLSHWQALQQCSKYLSVELEDAERVKVSSTAEAARYVSMNPSEPVAAIGHQRVGELYGLSLLEQSVEDNPHNQTRFMLLCRSDDLADHPRSPQGGPGLTKIMLRFQGLTQLLPESLEKVLESGEYSLVSINSFPGKREMGVNSVLLELLSKGEGPRSLPEEANFEDFDILGRYQSVDLTA